MSLPPIIAPHHQHKVDQFKIKAQELLSQRNQNFKLRKLLGRGKGGYSFQVSLEDKLFVLKLAHYEKVAYYDFGDNNKIQLELNDYHFLKASGITTPDLIESNTSQNFLLKEYISGKLAIDAIADNTVSDTVFEQLFDFHKKAQKAQRNLDYFPANFVITDNEKLHYIDYETSDYSFEWGLENWGLPYWCNNQGMKRFRKSQDIGELNGSLGIPRRNEQIDQKIAQLIDRFQ